jgi:predicted AlkP superfamily phosphohydrolase/phosphomutase
LRELILKKLLYKLGLTAERIDHLLFTLKIDFIENKFPRLRQVMRQSLPRVSTDWSNTQVYLIPEYEFSGISINLKGREPQGVVEQKEYEKLRDHIIRELYNIKDPENNERIIENALKREEVYYGPYLDKAPDILVLTKNQKYQISLKLHKTVLTSFNGFDHSMNGIFIFFGPDVKRDVKIGGVKIFDLAPTILHILNTPVPRDMDGRVLKEVFREDSELATKEIVYQEVEEKEKIKQKVGELRSLKKV